MNIKSKINERLYDVIDDNYKKEKYKNAILDAIYFISDLIREKTGLESDGNALAGQAFGGKNPKLKVNNLKTENEKNIQKGILFLFQGLYTAIRNPRSHRKIEDTKEDADSIIIFIDYLLNIIDKSKTQFVKEELLERVSDPDFVETDEYAELLVKEIPTKYQYDILVEAYKMRNYDNKNKLYYFIKALLKKVTKEEQNNIYKIISDNLKTTQSNEEIICTLAILPYTFWGKIDDIAKIRIENKMINSVKKGKYWKMTDKTIESLGTWTDRIALLMRLKKEYFSTVLNKLEKNSKLEQDYVFHYLIGSIKIIIDENQLERARTLIIDGLSKDDERYYYAFSKIDSYLPLYNDDVINAIKQYEINRSKVTDDDVPF